MGYEIHGSILMLDLDDMNRVTVGSEREGVMTAAQPDTDTYRVQNIGP